MGGVAVGVVLVL